MRSAFTMILLGVLWVVIGLVLEATVLSQAATSGADSNAPSFAGARAINDLIPLIYNMVIAVGAAGLIGIGVWRAKESLSGNGG